MVRTQIQLTPEQHRRLKRWAHQRGISLAEAVRRCVTEHLAEEGTTSSRADRVREALGAIGKYRDPSGETDVAREHDAALTDAYRR
jgi:hypothetical protein